MKAVILAAGISSRLRPITERKPKCLVRVADAHILDYQLRAYAKAGLRDIIILAGYKAAMVRQHCQQMKDLNVKIIENVEFATTNNMYSLYLCLEDVEGQPFILSNGDVILNAEIMRDLAEDSRGDLIVTEAGAYNDESMKIDVDSTGAIVDISKTIPREKAYGTSTDVYKFSANAGAVFASEVRRIIEEERNVNEWTELALQRLLQRGSLKMHPFDIGAGKWIEIDNYDDLALADRMFSSFDRSLCDKRVVFIDLDGTMYIGDTPIPAAKEFIKRLSYHGIPFYFLSNNSSRAKRDYVAKLASIGIETNEEQILLSSDGLISYLVENDVRNVFVIGTESLRESIAVAGIDPVSHSPEYVVLGYDTELTYEKLRQGALHLNKGVRLLATHCDLVCPTPEGPIPDIGSMLALFEAATGKRPDKVFGKPNAEMIQHVIDRHKAVAKQALVIGDRLYTDKALADAIGCDFVLVLSGETTREDVEECDNPPALIIPDVGHIG